MGGSKFKLVFFLLFIVKSIKASVVVETDLGKVAGVEVKSIIKDEKYFSFMGIPYGKAPVGSLRFKAPEPHEGWTKVLNAKKEKQPCSQFNIPIRPLTEYGFWGQDDCLHLSIHTPKLPSNDNEQLKLPVVVFQYNEHFRLNHNATKDYGPDFFMKEDVIIVMISHRLAVEGFLAFEDEELPGNNGIRDFLLGLQWLKRNVQKFGGDPENITLMGVEAGAALVDVLLQSVKAKGLFNKAIMHSSTSWNPIYFPPSPKEKARTLAKYLEKSAVTSKNLINELSSLTPEKIAIAEPESINADESRLSQRSKIPFGPVVEPEHPDAIITKLPEDEPINIDVPIMMGYNSRESLEIMERFLRKPQYLTFADRDFLFNFPIRDNFHFEFYSDIYHEAIQEIKDFYFDEGYVKISKPSEFITYIFDVMFLYPFDYAVRNYVKASKLPIYYYSFDYSGDLNMRKKRILKEAMSIDGTWGASTGDELCYLFVCKSNIKPYIKVLEDEESEEFTVLRNMIKMWTNFAKSGNPTPPGSDFTWTPATEENKDCLVISEEPQMKTNLHADRIEWWDNFLAKYKAMAVDGVIKDENKKDEL